MRKESVCYRIKGDNGRWNTVLICYADEGPPELKLASFLQAMAGVHNVQEITYEISNS